MRPVKPVAEPGLSVAALGAGAPGLPRPAALRLACLAAGSARLPPTG